MKPAVMKTRALAASLAALTACGSSSKAADKSVPAIEAKANRRPAEKPLEFVGIVTTRDSKVVTSEFEGRVVALYVHAGQRVRAGQPIAKLDDSNVRKQLAAATAAVDAARAELGRAGVEVRAAKREMRIERRLYRRGAVAREKIRQADFDRGRAGASYGSVSAQHRQAVAERQQLEQHLARATLFAPIDGVVSMLRLKEGELARPGTPVARVFDPRDLWVRFAVDNEYRALIKAGTRVTTTVAATGATFEAVVRSVSTDLEPPLQFIVADADVDDRQVDSQSVGVGVVGSVRLQPSPESPGATPPTAPSPPPGAPGALPSADVLAVPAAASPTGALAALPSADLLAAPAAASPSPEALGAPPRAEIQAQPRAADPPPDTAAAAVETSVRSELGLVDLPATR